MWNPFSNNRSLFNKQRDLINTIEGIGDILVYETSLKHRNKTVINGLGKLEEIVKKLFDLKDKDPDKFDQIILSEEFFKLFKEDKDDARYRLGFKPEKYLVTYTSIINQFIRIYESALQERNFEISRFTVYHLNWILAKLSTSPNNELFIEHILTTNNFIFGEAIKIEDISMYAASIHWYTDIVFDRLGDKENAFDLSYLELFDKYFFSSIKIIITEDQKTLFGSLVSSFIDGLHIPIYNKRLYEYELLLRKSLGEKFDEKDKEIELINRLGELEKTQDELNKVEDVSNWLKQYEDFDRAIGPLIKTNLQAEYRNLKEEVLEYTLSFFKYNNLLEIIYGIGAYCLFKNRPNLVRQLWEAKQPTDADGSWGGLDIIQSNLPNAIEFFFKRGLYERKFDFWERHHGSEIYYKKYLLLMLARIVHSIQPDEAGNYTEIRNFNLSRFNVFRLSSIEHSIEGLITIAKELKNEKDTLSVLRFDMESLNELFDKKLIPFLSVLKTKAIERLKIIQKEKSISKNKIIEFQKDVIKNFYESIVMRSIFQNYLIYDNKCDE